MSRSRWHAVQDLFFAARERVGEERERQLAAAGASATVLADVRALLDADAGEGVLDVLQPRLAPLDHVVAGDAPEVIGAYRIVREIGRGGMGVVHLAERDDGQFRQRVAIKLIATPDPADPLHRRFLIERRILAGLEHPNIARLLDGGVTERGLPYLVMEYVEGEPITTYADRLRLDVRARLLLFAEVCDAVQHAHRNLVIHRDLKPGNILVDGAGRVRLLDFGIAKLVGPADDRPDTRAERAMTPGWASPEQVRGEPLTTASDIHALGTLLYELLTGSHPYTSDNPSTAELLAAICERDAERPSARVLRTDVRVDGDLTPTNRALTRGTTVARLRRALSTDLDAIVQMAMRKEPERRYASADLLRTDVERHLRGLPVHAHRGSRRYRLGKLVRRRRGAVAAAAAVVVSLAGGLGAALVQAREAAAERDRAQAARTEAELALAQSQEVTDFLMDMFQSGGSSAAVDALTVVDLLQRATARADALDRQPAVQARLLDVVGQLSLQLGRYDEAQAVLERAVEIRRGPAGGSEELASSLIHLAHVHRSRSEIFEARGLVTEALAIRKRSLPSDHSDVAAAYHELGWLSFGSIQEHYYRQAIAILRDSNREPELLLDVMHGLATNQRRRGRTAEAVAIDRQALLFAEQAFGLEDAHTGYAMIHLADQVADLQDDAASAERLYRRGLGIMEARLGPNSVRLLHGLNAFGTLLGRTGRHDEATRVLRRALDVRRAATGPDHPQVADQLRLLARQLLWQGRSEEASTLATDALALVRRTRGTDHPSIARVYLPLLAQIAEQRGRHGSADSLYLIAIDGGRNADLIRDHGRFLTRTGDFARAETQLLRSLELLRPFEGDDAPRTRETKRALAELYTAWNRPADVERYRVPPGSWIAY